ncbi:MAG: PQQ-binding-like beta-propeller repeat protein [Thermoplasmata archaeon]|nr:MAG: PQQ-binding-like beta-propeller repeat protein [Thermoplasmata archaeon]
MKVKNKSIFLCIVIITSISSPITLNISEPKSDSSGTGGLADSPWPMFRQNLNHTGLSPYDMSANPGKLKWSFETGDYVFSSPAINSDGTIYFGSTDNKIYAINPDGSEKWNFTTDGDVHSSPAISSEGEIYIGSKDGKVYAINLDGTEKWTFTTGSDVDSSPIIGSDGTIYVGSHDYRLYAINPDGSEKWTFMTGNKINDCSPAINSEGIIYIGSSDNKFYAINPDGTEKWNFITGGVISSSPTIGVDGTLYFGSGDGNLYALNSDGSEKWRFAIGSYIFSSPAINSDNIIYVGSNDYKLYAINPDGTEKWNFLTGFIVESSPSIGSDGSIYFGSKDNKVYAINPDGTERWNFTTKNGILSSPAIDSDGTIYIGSYDNKLYAIGSLNIPPIANSGPDQIINEGSLIQFDTSSSYDPDGTIETYEWDFESDGIYDYVETAINSPDGIFDGKINHVYGDNGVYIVTLRVTDDTGDSDTDTCDVIVKNLAPTIYSISSPSGSEGAPIIFISTSTDQGSDDLTFTWEWGDGTSATTTTYYNNGASPDPPKSPWGIYPFTVMDTVQHTYGDNGVYTITMKVTDDDRGITVITAEVVVNNVAPTITLDITPSRDEGSSITFEADATDPGSDDLAFFWEFEYGPIIQNRYYNNGVNPEPVYMPITNEIKSPQGTYPFNASDIVTHTYGDNYNYTMILTVTDDDGAVTTYTTIVSVDNVAPSIIELAIPYVAYEGTSATYRATVKDLGSDDLTFEWDFGDSTPVIERTYYNNGTTPDPYPSPDGIFPFIAQDTIDHTYGDNYNYTLTFKVTDDDGDVSTLTTTVYVDNVAPTIKPFGPFTVDEGMPLDLTAISTDLGSDDLTFTWEFEYGPTYVNSYYNDGAGPDPYPSPWGIYPFTATDNVGHIYGDNGVFGLTLTVEDDDGDSTTFITNITVKNVAPVIEKIEAYVYVNISLRVAGEKYHSVDIYLYEEDSKIWTGKVTRYPGSPDEQKAKIANVKLDMTKRYSAKVDYLPNDPRINGNVWGGNPVWIEIEFENESTARIHHTFNVRQSYWNSDHWNHIDPWEVELNPHLVGHNITLEGIATDPGSDDLTFTWDFGDGVTAGPTTYYNNGLSPDPYPSPEINPMNVTDTCVHSYTTSGTYMITLVVEDDDGGITITTLEIGL